VALKDHVTPEYMYRRACSKGDIVSAFILRFAPLLFKKEISLTDIKAMNSFAHDDYFWQLAKMHFSHGRTKDKQEEVITGLVETIQKAIVQNPKEIEYYNRAHGVNLSYNSSQYKKLVGSVLCEGVMAPDGTTLRSTYGTPQLLELIADKNTGSGLRCSYESALKTVMYKDLKEKTKLDLAGFAKEFMEGKKDLKDVPGMKPFFRLNPPVKGFGAGVKVPFSLGGALGYRKDKINELIKRML